MTKKKKKKENYTDAKINMQSVLELEIFSHHSNIKSTDFQLLIILTQYN